MEVHHHPMAIGSHTPGKKWAHYIWEFLMLFLAVFTGFLAENQREHYIEHQRAKIYAKSLLNDLHVDTSAIKNAMKSESATSVMIDSLVIFISGTKIYEQGERLYYLMRRANNFYSVEWSRATMNQLISSGNLRYFTNNELISLISDYNTWQHIISVQEDGVLSHRNRATAFRDQIFKAELFLRSILELNVDSMKMRSGLQTTNWPVMNKDPQLINSYANALINTKPYRQRLKIQYYPQAIDEATKIMELLRKEYHLE